MARRRHLRDRLIGVGLRLLARLPLRVNHALGGAVGALVWYLPTRAARITHINLALCFPEKDPAWRRRVGRRSLMAMGRALTESPWLWQSPPESLETLAVQPPQYARLRERSAGRALFLCAPHLGSWEFAGLHAACHGPMATLYSPFKTPEVDRWVREARASTGAELAPADRSGLRILQQARDRGEIIGILPDQSPKGASGQHASFFGRPALTMTLLPRLLRGRADHVVFLFAERLPGGRGYRYHEVVAGPEVADRDFARAAAAINRHVETLVRRCPEQYNWAYKRFNPPPAGWPDPYRRGAPE
ncbi:MULTISPECIES: lysophospholipid acyltransferase family protein [Thioalkalivibrio]|uniref:lysophospholipid acyltransferase family protein n=1 Tax=Thioalkalivibrio TaxID=106633 RepID=UPI0003772BBA|nr:MULTISPECIES: lipid A biosynthesis acyltransferase [Thioalkalivibrio]OOC48878.1 lipid A biosynthesis acyltransferase [Thioalkalivibrio versutus]